MSSYPPEHVVVSAQRSTLNPAILSWRQREPWSLLARDAVVQLIITAFVLATLIASFVVYPHHRYNVSVDGALYLVAVTLPALAMLLTALRSPDLRRPWLFMTGGVIANSLADLVYATHDQHLHPIPNPAPSDALYVISYSCFIVGVLLITRVRGDRTRASLRLDGFIAAAALASLVAFIWFNPLVARGAGTLRIVVDLAYPFSDLVMLALLAISLGPRRYRPTWSSGLLLGGIAWFLLGDVLHVNQIATNTVHAVSFTDTTFVVGLWMMGIAASTHDRRNAPRHSRRVETSLSVAAVPVFSGVLAISVIAASWAWNRPPEVGGLALTALTLVMVRMWLALREERRLVLSSSLDARTDALTGLANRRRLFERIDELLGGVDASQVGVILIDLDGFKEVNDEIGHAAGDELLRIIAQRFTRRVANRGNLARLGGDEFAIVSVAPEATLVALARELLETTSQEFSLQGHRVRLGASMGVSLAREGDADAFELLRRADVAMYEAKKRRSGVAVYSSSSDVVCRREPLSHSANSLISVDPAPSGWTEPPTNEESMCPHE
ncbi:MAG: GGDEF domain-containing protein [Actinomycetota bacterium]|nr:GGDEF domain-containing protein [Actinomycetota bacterium]